MLEADEPTVRAETAARQRYLVPGVGLRISDLTDTLGGYACSVVDVSGRTIWIDLPIRRDGMLSLSPGQLVSVRFDRPDDALYLFDSVVADQRDDDQAPFGLAMPVTINRRPHRSDTRLSLVLDASFEAGDARGGEAKVVDLSAGGLGLICDHELRTGEEVVVRCTLPGPGDIPLRIDHPATVCSSSLYGRTPGGTTLFQHGLRFVDPDEAMRERILGAVIWNLTRNVAVL
jgi:c-di-GMP-binding flagellar brake protein YcgR